MSDVMDGGNGDVGIDFDAFDPANIIVASEISVDFINTATNRFRDTQPWGDYFLNYDKVIDWFLIAGLVTEEEHDKLIDEKNVSLIDREGFFCEALKFRALLRNIYLPLSQQKAPLEVNLTSFAKVCASAHAMASMTWVDGRLEMAIDRTRSTSPIALLYEIAFSAEKFLGTLNMQRLRICESSTCEWLFYDTSKNGRRRWCKMSVCGNREKSRRRSNFYAPKAGRSADNKLEY